MTSRWPQPLVDDDNYDIIDDAITELAAHRKRARRLGAAGIAYVQNHHNRRELSARFVQVVESLLP